jgi:hypothetical protein
MTSNVLPLYFEPSQASSSQNLNVDNLQSFLKTLGLDYFSIIKLIGFMNQSK